MESEPAMAHYQDDDTDTPPVHRRRKTDGSIRIQWSMVFQIVGYVVGLFLMWNAMTNRVTALETRVDGLRGDVTEIKTDIKELLLRGK